MKIKKLHIMLIMEFIVLISFAIFFGYLESLTEDAAGFKWWIGMFGIFMTIGLILPTYYIIDNYSDLQWLDKLNKVMRVFLMVIGFMLITVVIEDFCAIAFAGMFDWVGGVNGSLMGVPYLCPKTGVWIEPVFPAWYIKIINFKIPVFYFIFIGIGLIVFYLSFKYSIDLVKLRRVNNG